MTFSLRDSIRNNKRKRRVTPAAITTPVALSKRAVSHLSAFFFYVVCHTLKKLLQIFRSVSSRVFYRESNQII